MYATAWVCFCLEIPVITQALYETMKEAKTGRKRGHVANVYSSGCLRILLQKLTEFVKENESGGNSLQMKINKSGECIVDG